MVAGAAFVYRRRSNEGKIDCDLLLEQLLAVRALDRGVCFFKGGVFDKDVALDKVNACFLSPAQIERVP
jgi:hypothetical protein